MTNAGIKQVYASDPSRISRPAAWFAIIATLATILILAALHVLSPEFSPHGM